VTHAKAKIIAKRIREERRSIDDVDEADRADVRAAYLKLFGDELNGCDTDYCCGNRVGSAFDTN